MKHPGQRLAGYSKLIRKVPGTYIGPTIFVSISPIWMFWRLCVIKRIKTCRNMVFESLHRIAFVCWLTFNTLDRVFFQLLSFCMINHLKDCVVSCLGNSLLLALLSKSEGFVTKKQLPRLFQLSAHPPAGCRHCVLAELQFPN